MDELQRQIEILMKGDGMTFEEAFEYVDYNGFENENDSK